MSSFDPMIMPTGRDNIDYVELTLVVLKNGRGIERQFHIIADKWEFSKFHLSSTTDGYGPARAWCGYVPLPHACAPCSQAHRPVANVAVEGATQDLEAAHAVVRPV